MEVKTNMATDLVDTEAATESAFVDVATGESYSGNVDDINVVRRTVTLTYTMAFKDGTPEKILFPERDNNLEYATIEIAEFAPYDLKVTSATSTLLTGDERKAHLDEAERINAQNKKAHDLMHAAEGGDEAALMELLFGPDFAKEINL